MTITLPDGSTKEFDQPVSAYRVAEAFDAGDSNTVGLEQMAAVPPEAWDGLTFSFHPSLRRLDLVLEFLSGTEP